MAAFRTAIQCAMPRSQKHHYIPVFYLKQWADIDGRLCEFSKPHDVVKSYRKYPDATGYMRGLYTFSGLPPAAANFLENVFFLRSDDGAAIVHRRLLADEVDFDGDAMSAWSRFIMTLFHRNPEAIERITNKVTVEFPLAMEKYRANYETERHASDPPTFEDFQRRMTSEALEKTYVLVLQKIMDSELIGTALNAMIWGVMRVRKSRFPLLTSDRPIVMTNGLARQDAHLIMPISPDRMFVAAKNQETMRKLDLQGQRGDLVEMLNNRVVCQARKFVYCSNDKQLRFVSNRLGERATWSPWE
jgi:hypothetical protein